MKKEDRSCSSEQGQRLVWEGGQRCCIGTRSLFGSIVGLQSDNRGERERRGIVVMEQGTILRSRAIRLVGQIVVRVQRSVRVEGGRM